MNHGFVKVATAIPSVKVADCTFNTEHIERLIIEACENQVEIVCFPELCITAYTCQDLFSQQLLLEEAELSLMKLTNAIRALNIITIVGLPVSFHGALYNCAAVLFKGKILGIVPKSYLPNYKEFYEMRWFASALDMPNATINFAGQTTQIGPRLLFASASCTFGIEICEDLWAPIPTGSQLTLQGAEIIFNPSADNDAIGKHEYLKSLISQQSARTLSGYVFAGCGFGESTQDVIFSGKAFIYEEGHLLAEAKRFSMDEQLIMSEIDVDRLRNERRTNTTFTASVSHLNPSQAATIIDTHAMFDNTNFKLSRNINPHPFVPEGPELDLRCEEIIQMQVQGLAKRLLHTHSQTLVVGISGGLDSTLALLICVKVFDALKLSRKGIVGITMPGFGTTNRTYTNATNLMKFLGVSIREIGIADACMQHFKDLNIDEHVHDVTYENSQARERTQILMDAANQMNGLVVGTGDLSELALGWATYNGDHMSMYGVNVSVPKTLVRHLVVWMANRTDDQNCKTTLLDIADTPISPELLPADAQDHIAQKTEDLVGPYELHDFFLYYFLRFGFSPSKIFFLACQAFENSYDKKTIKHWLEVFHRRFFAQQFKRSCLPDGPKVGSCSLSPRGDWRMPSDADSSNWLSQCNQIQDSLQ
jgi:NAD+ synthase (glutamine-hydrolysing)